jgi:outer membrane protein assembly factor BamB
VRAVRAAHALRRPLRVSALALVALGSLGGCQSSTEPPRAAPSVPLAKGSPWPKFRGNAAQTGRVDVKPQTSSALPWRFATGKGIFSSPVVGADGTVYVGSADRTFYALHEDGTLAWKLLTGEIIDSSALLDDRGRVYFGSGDSKLRALDAATGNVVWTMQADDPATNQAFINWFEGNVAIGPSGALYVPNDNFNLYAVDRDTGVVSWRFKMPDQTWSLPAVDAATGELYVGNNNTVALLGANVYQIDPNGQSGWQANTPGTNAASPMLADGAMFVGGFDGFVHAYDLKEGAEQWSFATRDHVYASPAQGLDGSLIQASTDGTVYALDPKTAAVKWTYDVGEPVRSSPAVDAAGTIYFGAGDGRLYALDGDGTLRWSMLLIADTRNDLNSSPALGAHAVYLGGEDGGIFSVPYDWCLGAGKSDPRCAAPTQAVDGVHLAKTTAFGAVEQPPATRIDANEPLAFALTVRQAGRTELATIDPATLAVTLDPPLPASDFAVEIAGDGKFFTITPKTRYAKGTDGKLAIKVRGKYLTGFDRDGLRLSGGHVGGDLSADFSFTLQDAPTKATVVAAPGDGALGTVWELSRLALPLPTIMPSYNQIGFDSLHYLVSVVELDASGHGVAWMEGAILAEGSNQTVIDPATKSILPLEVSFDQGLLMLSNSDGLRVDVMNVTIPFRTFRIGARLGDDGKATTVARLSGSTVCAQVPFYGTFLQRLGLCNPTTDQLAVFGGANFGPFAAPKPPVPATVTFARTANAVTATLAGSIKSSDHVASILLVSTTDGKPLPLDYGTGTTRTLAGDGTITQVRVPLGATPHPEDLRAYLMIDAAPVAKGTVKAP